MKRTVMLSSLISISVVVVVFLAAISVSKDAISNESGTNGISVIQSNTHILQDAGDRAPVLVEFLDFECEACGAFYPYIEELKREFKGEVTFAFRYFPLPGHSNSVNAALSVEAAAEQGKLEEMFSLVFETQSLWGESSESKAATFRSYAEKIGLDMNLYDSSIANPETLRRITDDYNDGVALGISGTPTFFLNNQRLTLRTFEDVRAAILDQLSK
jgi:protein-disulfide isomerase